MTHAPDTLARPAEWVARAVCARQPYAGSDLWYADEWDKETCRTAISLCHIYPVSAACRAATAREEAGKGLKNRYGIRAGMTPRQRWRAEQVNRA